LAFGVIITGIITYTVHPPKTATETLNIADSKQSSSSRAPVTLVSVSYQDSVNISESPAVEAHLASHNTDDTCHDQLMSGHDCVPTS